MTLWLNKVGVYVNSYSTNSAYLINMASLQMKALKEMKWGGEYIHFGLWVIPLARSSKINTERTVKGFINYLNEKIMRL